MKKSSNSRGQRGPKWIRAHTVFQVVAAAVLAALNLRQEVQIKRINKASAI